MSLLRYVVTRCKGYIIDQVKNCRIGVSIAPGQREIAMHFKTPSAGDLELIIDNQQTQNWGVKRFAYTKAKTQIEYNRP